MLYTIISEYDVLLAENTNKESGEPLQCGMLSTDLNDFLTDTRLQIKMESRGK